MLDVVECVGTPNCAQSRCANCDYRRNSPTCGQSPSGALCTYLECVPYLVFMLCGKQMEATIELLEIGVPHTALLANTGAFSQLFSFYVTAGHCQPLRVTLTVHSGNDALYYVLMDADSLVKVVTSGGRFAPVADSYIPTMTVCPDAPFYPGADGQTLFIAITGALQSFRAYPYASLKLL